MVEPTARNEISPPAATDAAQAEIRIQRAPPQAAPMARLSLLIYLLLIAYASLYPLSGWRDALSPPFSYLNLNLPRYWTWFDFITNILAYIPLGTLTVFALYPRVRRWPAALLAVLAGSALSLGIEAMQNFLPSRVPSNLDLFTNTLGSLLGALFGLWQTRAFLDHGYLHLLRKRWFIPGASRGLLALGLWPLAQLYPQAYLFGHGQIMPIVSDWLSDLLETPVDLNAMALHGAEISVQQYWLSEVVITASGLCGAVLTLCCLLRTHAPRLQLIMVLFASCLLAKCLASALVFNPEHALLWLTPGAQGGLLIGILMLSGFVFVPPQVQRRLAVLMLLISLVASNLIPANPYFNASLQTWVQGKFLNFNGAAQILALSWPVLAIWSLWYPDPAS